MNLLRVVTRDEWLTARQELLAGEKEATRVRDTLALLVVDTKGVSRLYRPAPSGSQVAMLLFVALLTMVIVVLSSPQLERLVDLLWLKIQVLLES